MSCTEATNVVLAPDLCHSYGSSHFELLINPLLLSVLPRVPSLRYSRDDRHLLALEHLLDGSGGVRLGSLEGHTESSVPDELRSNTESSGNTEQDGVEVLLVETVVGKEDTRVGIHVGPGVWDVSKGCYCDTEWLTLGLSGLKKDVGDNLVDLTDKLEEWVIGEVLEGKLSLSSVSRVLSVSAAAF